MSRLLGYHFPEDVHDYKIDRVGFQIFLFEEKDASTPSTSPGIEHMMASRFITNITILSDLDELKPILIHMKTYGGDWDEAMAMYDAIVYCPNPVTILAYAHARSCSSVILQAADRRVLTRNCYFMLHKGTLGLAGTHNEVIQNAEWAKREHDKMVQIYAERAMKGKRFRHLDDIKTMKMIIEDEMDKKGDVILSPEQAVEWGLADRVFNGNWATLRAT